MTYNSAFSYCRQAEERVQSQQSATKRRACKTCGKRIPVRPSEGSTKGCRKSKGIQQATTTYSEVEDEPVMVEQVELLERSCPGSTKKDQSKPNGKNVPPQVTNVRQDSYDEESTDSDGETQYKSMYMATFKKKRISKREPGERATWKTEKGLRDFHHKETEEGPWMATYEMMHNSESGFS